MIMGGRGASSGLAKKTSKSNTDIMTAFRNAGTIIVDKEVQNLNSALVDKTLKGVRDTLKEFGLPLSVVASIGLSLSNDAVASANGMGQLGLSSKHYSSSNNEFVPSDYTVDYTAYGTGTHEAGHLISNYLMRKNNSSLTRLQQANLRSSGKWDRNILKQAKKINGGKLSAISKYGSNTKGKAAGEVVAEAVSEYMKKGKSASSTSKAIVQVLKSYV